MVSLNAEDRLALKDLARFVEPVEICDGSGKLIGLFVPANLERGKQLYAKAATEINWQEIKRRSEAEGPGEPLQHTLDRLKLLEKEMERRKVAGERDFTTEEALAYFQALSPPALGPAAASKAQEVEQCATP